MRLFLFITVAIFTYHISQRIETFASTDYKERPSLLRISVVDSKTKAPLSCMLNIVNKKDGKSKELEVKNGSLEKLFMEPAELEFTLFAKDYTSVTRSVAIMVSQQGNVYPFAIELERITNSLTIKVVDVETGEGIPEARIDVKDLRNNTVTTLLSGLSEKNEILIAGQGQYEITCALDGYNTDIIAMNLDRTRREVLVKIKRKAKPPQIDVVKDTSKFSEENKSRDLVLKENRIARQNVITNDLPKKSSPVEKVETIAFGELKKGKAIALNNIFFDQSSPILRPESFTELDKLVGVLQENPLLRIEIRGHTDNTGNFDANVKLSRERCESVVNYLIDKGISKNRLQYVGRGPVNPLVPNTTEENKKKNRRVEFLII